MPLALLAGMLGGKQRLLWTCAVRLGWVSETLVQFIELTKTFARGGGRKSLKSMGDIDSKLSFPGQSIMPQDHGVVS
jgi:hypothetical protein